MREGLDAVDAEQKQRAFSNEPPVGGVFAEVDSEGFAAERADVNELLIGFASRRVPFSRVCRERG